jgi:hypothetical protein
MELRYDHMATAKKTSGRKYGPAASRAVEREMKAMEAGTLRSGGSGKKVTNPKQAIAIALSEARRAGAKVPPAPKTAGKKVAGTKRSAEKKTAAKQTVKKAATKRVSAKKIAVKKKVAAKKTPKKSAA